MDRLISRKQIADRPLWDGQSSTNWRARNTTARERSESPQFSTHKQHERTTKTPRLNYSSSLNQQTSNQTPSPSADLQESPVLDDGRRICVANLLYKAQMSDIRSLFERNGFKMWVIPLLISQSQQTTLSHRLLLANASICPSTPSPAAILPTASSTSHPKSKLT